MAHAVARTGVPALGIDISRRMVAEARARGAQALRRDVFGELPAVGRWHHVLLIDGNIGIAADPVALLRRCRESLRDGGTLLVEVEPSGHPTELTSLRLRIDHHVSAPIPWARVGLDAVDDLAAVTTFEVVEVWGSGARSFASLRRPHV